MNIKTESWCGYVIRFVEVDGEWWAILKDICDALSSYNTNYLTSTILGDDLVKKVNVDDKWEMVTNEIGIYKIIFSSECLEARKFRRWSAEVMRKLRRQVGLEPYEAMRMMESKIQEDIDHILDALFYDEKTGKLMQSVTVAGGDVEQIPFE